MGFLDFLKRGPGKRCARCGGPAAHGYSLKSESDSSRITPLCVPCLIDQLQRDYVDFRGRAIVIAPAPGLPCYVFRDREIPSSLRQQIVTCADCEGQARCLWIESRGLTIENFEDVLEKGPERTLLTWGNPAMRSLCGTCTAKRIGKNLQAGGLEFFEVCSPHDQEEGIVIPMAY
jgi:hypothetical protein